MCLESSHSKVGLISCALFCFILLGGKWGQIPSGGHERSQVKHKDGRVADLSLWLEGKFKSKENMNRQPINPHKNRGKKAHLIA